MENFSNPALDTLLLPRFEDVPLKPVHPKYWLVLIIGYVIGFLVIGAALGLMLENISEWEPYKLEIVFAFLVISAISLICARIAFRKKGYAFREHDVILRQGIIATNTIIIPYNRIQHVALNEGVISRRFGLASVGIYTAGASGSDIEIPGIEKEHAENIKQLLMGKIREQL